MTHQNTINQNNNDCQKTDILIIGSGLSGLSVALTLPQSLHITVLSKDSLDTCSSYYAQGGIAGMLASDDSVTAHVKDTLTAGDGLCHPANTGQILQQGVNAINWLCEQGVPFTSTTSHEENEKKVLHLTREGGHSHRRIAHADDATGEHIMKTLFAKAHAQANIHLLTQHEVIELLIDDSHDDKHCYGASVLNRTNNQLCTITAKSVVLASGGLGQMFKRATAPNVCIGDGAMMAWQIGCRLANLEFVQFHPTGLAVDGQDTKSSNFLISEAVRGEGGLLYCPISGKRFMLDVDERAELAPRDIVARAIYKKGKLNGLGYVNLDISHRPAEFVKNHFPQIYQYCLTVGLDITQQPIPVAPTAHYSCGGILTTAEGLTDVVGLYAVGEVAYTGLHGANRLASNSLLECVVVGRQVANHLAQNLTDNLSNKNLAESWQYPQPHIENNKVLNVSLDKTQMSNLTMREPQLSIGNTATFAEEKQHYHKKTTQLKQLMNDHMGIERTQTSLQSAYQQLEQWQRAESDSYHASIEQLRWQRLLTLAQLMIQSALARQESRGGHYRSDFLNKNSQVTVSVVN